MKQKEIAEDQEEEQEIYEVLVVKDKSSHDDLSEFIQASPYFDLKETAQDSEQATNLLKRNRYDLVFADISHYGLSGLQFIGENETKPNLIVASVSKDFAIKAYEMGVIDYLLKPVTKTRFEMAQEKALEILRYRRSLEKAGEKDPQKNLSDVPLIEILQNIYKLTPQEAQISKMFFDGQPREEIIATLKIAKQTLKQHLRAIFSKTIDLETEKPVKHHGKLHALMTFMVKICQESLLEEDFDQMDD